MKKTKSATRSAPRRSRATKAIDFSGGVRGKYARRAGLVRLVELEPDVAAAFPTADAVNAALRALSEIARRSSTRAAKRA